VEESANFVAKEETENNDVVLLANKEIGPEKENVWYLDTGASNHMCGYKYMFTELKEIADGHVSFGDASKVRVEGEGNICWGSHGANRKPFRLKVRNDRRTKISMANLSSGLNWVCQETFQDGPSSVFLWHQNPI
jgi:hypothetical protein